MIQKDHDFRYKKPAKQLTKIQHQYIEKYNNDLEQFTFEYVECECHSKNDYTLSYRDKYGLRCNNVICLDCGLLRINPRMDKRSLGLFYEEYYRLIYAGHEFATDEFFNEQYNRSLERIYSFSKQFLTGNEKILEIGCGAGGIIKAFQDKGFEVEGCDLGSKYLSYGQNKGLTLYHSSSHELVKKNKKYDFIILSNVFEHLSNLKEELESIHFLLNNDGKVYIDLPGVLHVKVSHSRLFNFLQNAHNYNFSLTTLTKTLESQGFKLLKGNELIRSIFLKTDVLIPYEKDEKHAQEVLMYLEESEQYIHIRWYFRLLMRNILFFLQNKMPIIYNALRFIKYKIMT